MLKSRLWITDDKIFLWRWCLKVGIPDTSYKRVNVMKRGIQKHDPDCLLWHNSCIAHITRRRVLVRIIDSTRLASEIHSTPKTKCLLDWVYPGHRPWSSSKILKVTKTLYISLTLTSCQNLFLLSLSISWACSTNLGISTPYFQVFLATQEFTDAIILSCFFGVKCAHQEKADSSEISLTIT